MHKMLFLGLIGVTAMTLVTTSAGMTAAVKISTRKLPKLGTVLVNSKGRTLYMFVPDKRKKVTCVRTCAAAWPPVKLPKGSKAVAVGKVKAGLLGSDRNPTGGRVVTYNKWPLYTYVGDTAPGQAEGQALNLNGGLWYVLSPSGKVIKTK
jgi:predicted lipoprotein with Yx(FWY)xxD motif